MVVFRTQFNTFMTVSQKIATTPKVLKLLLQTRAASAAHCNQSLSLACRRYSAKTASLKLWCPLRNFEMSLYARLCPLRLPVGRDTCCPEGAKRINSGATQPFSIFDIFVFLGGGTRHKPRTHAKPYIKFSHTSSEINKLEAFLGGITGLKPKKRGETLASIPAGDEHSSSHKRAQPTHELCGGAQQRVSIRNVGVAR